MPRKQRTLQQNKSLHKFCELLADALNDAGYEMKKVLEAKAVDVPWNKYTVKEVLWRPIQTAMTGKTSTTELNTVDPSEVYDVLMRHMNQHFGINVEWPSHQGDLEEKA